MNKTRLTIALGLLGLLALAAYSYYVPQTHLRQIRVAAEAKDSERLRELIDFDAVKSGLKEDMRAMLMSSMQQDSSSNPFAALGVMMFGAILDPMVDMMVSPTSIVAMIDLGRVETKGTIANQGRNAPANKDASSATASDRKRAVLVEQGYEGYNRYRISLKPVGEADINSISLRLRREGLFSWKVSQIILPTTLFERKSSDRDRSGGEQQSGGKEGTTQKEERRVSKREQLVKKDMFAGEAKAKRELEARNESGEKHWIERERLAAESELKPLPQEKTELAAKLAKEQATAQVALNNRYLTLITSHVKRQIVEPPNLQGNPQAEFDVVLLPGGEVLTVRLRRTSGVPAYDAAVERAILKASPLPVPADPALFSQFRDLRLAIRPRE